MTLILYYDFISQPARAVYIFLTANNIPFEKRLIALRKGEHQTASFREINPCMFLPVIVDDGFVLCESCAILKYLCYKYKVPLHWCPNACLTLTQKSRLDEFFFWQLTCIRNPCALLYQQLAVIPKSTNQPINWTICNTYRQRARIGIQHLDKFYLQGKSYVWGDDVSIADLLVVCELMQLHACCEEELYKENKNVDAWVNRVQQRLEPAFSESIKVVNLVRKQYPLLTERFHITDSKL